MNQNYSMLPTKSAGYSMLEVLISMVIIAFAMLGAANLQLNSLKMSKGANFRTQAILLSSEIAERMEANKTASVAGSYAVALTNTTPASNTTCDSAPCTPADLASYDVAQWGARLSTALKGASWKITQTTAGNPSTYEIVINWQDRRENTTYSDVNTVDTFSLTTTRTIHQ